MKFATTLALALVIFASAAFAQSQPVPDTFISTGAISNYSSPYHVAPYAAAGTLINGTSSALPTYAGMRYELYMDASGKPAYAGLASVKVIAYRKNRYFCFGEVGLGGAGSVSGISSAVDFGGGCGLQVGYRANGTPHWEVFVEPKARRIPALANGTSPALLVGVAYTFNRPK